MVPKPHYGTKRIPDHDTLKVGVVVPGRRVRREKRKKAVVGLGHPGLRPKRLLGNGGWRRGHLRVTYTLLIGTQSIVANPTSKCSKRTQTQRVGIGLDCEDSLKAFLGKPPFQWLAANNNAREKDDEGGSGSGGH